MGTHIVATSAKDPCQRREMISLGVRLFRKGKWTGLSISPCKSQCCDCVAVFGYRDASPGVDPVRGVCRALPSCSTASWVASPLPVG